MTNSNNERICIEIGNKYHHQNNYERKRKYHFRKYGWKSFIFIMDKFDVNLVLNKLKCGGVC